MIIERKPEAVLGRTQLSELVHTILWLSYTSFCHLRPRIAKAGRGGRRGKVTAVITDNIVK